MPQLLFNDHPRSHFFLIMKNAKNDQFYTFKTHGKSKGLIDEKKEI
jgi:hypothetical protein